MVPAGNGGGIMYAIQGWADGQRETVYFDTWEEVLSCVGVLEEGMYDALLVTNMDSGKVVITTKRE